MADKKIGIVVHYYNKIGVAVVALKESLKIGDKIKIIKDDSQFEQEVTSMQKDRQPIEKAEKGQEIGLKVKQEVKRKAEVYKLD